MYGRRSRPHPMLEPLQRHESRKRPSIWMSKKHCLPKPATS
jgi:hypothetical protein